jgi:hypothetical protein
MSKWYWTLQTSGNHLNFALFWKLLSWQADLAVDLPDLPQGAVDPADLIEATQLHALLRELASGRPSTKVCPI